MFVKTSNINGNTYLQLVSNTRIGKKTKHKVIANLGNVDKLVSNGLENIISSLSKYLPNKSVNNKNDNETVNINSIKEVGRHNFGYIAYKKLWDRFDLTNLLSDVVKKRKIKYDFADLIFSLVINRLLNPSSKLYHYHHREKYIQTDIESQLHDIYRSLDILSENKDTIEYSIFDKNINLFDMNVDLLLYDVTTFHFESQQADELRDFGFSKANKVNEVQVVMGLLVDTEGRPIGFELFPGNTFDGKTMIRMLSKLKNKFNLNQVIIVADKGLNNKSNLKEIKDSGFDYIVSSRIKNMPNKLQNEILSNNGYTGVTDNEGNEVLKYKVIDYKNNFAIDTETGRVKVELTEKLACTFSTKRYSKDKYDRQRALEKAKIIVSRNDISTYQSKKGYKKYIAIKEDKKINKKLELDNDRISKESRFDGYYAIQYSRTDMSVEEVINRYHDLYKIEESFRILKSTMETRPIYLRTKEHIEGHFVICFLAFLLERELELRLRNNKIEYSAKKIQEALNSLEFSKLEHEKGIFYVSSMAKGLASKIFNTLKIKLPNNTLDESGLINYLN